MSPAEPAEPRGAAVVVFAVTLACGALALNRQLVGVFYDDGLYADVAYALTHGLGYVHPHLPGHPAVVHYPPLYPLVLSPFIGTLPLEAAGLAAKVLNVILAAAAAGLVACQDRKSTRLNSSHGYISYAVFCLKKKKKHTTWKSPVST